MPQTQSVPQLASILYCRLFSQSNLFYTFQYMLGWILFSLSIDFCIRYLLANSLHVINTLLNVIK